MSDLRISPVQVRSAPLLDNCQVPGQSLGCSRVVREDFNLSKSIPKTVLSDQIEKQAVIQFLSVSVVQHSQDLEHRAAFLFSQTPKTLASMIDT